MDNDIKQTIQYTNDLKKCVSLIRAHKKKGRELYAEFFRAKDKLEHHVSSNALSPNYDLMKELQVVEYDDIFGKR